MEIWEKYREDEFLELAAELAHKYTGGESTSVTFEKACQFMEAILYCIGTWEKESEGRYALCGTEKISAGEAYRMGYELVLKKVKKMRRLYHVLIRDFCSYGNRNYEDTILRELPEFFRRYDARFEPQNHILTLDYPILVSMDGFQGVDAIEQYLGCIRLEQRFMGAFDKRYVCRVLKENDWNYAEGFYNLCEILLADVLGCIICGKRPDAAPTEENRARLEEFVKSRTREELLADVERILGKLIEKQWNGDELLYEYLRASLGDLCTALYSLSYS